MKMESKDELKEIDIKNRTCYYFDNIIKDVDIYFSDILLDEKFHAKFQQVQNHCILGIRLDKIDGFIRVRGGEFRHLVLFDKRLFDKIFGKIKYL